MERGGRFLTEAGGSRQVQGAARQSVGEQRGMEKEACAARNLLGILDFILRGMRSPRRILSRE